MRSSGWSNYHGLQAEIRRRFTGGYYYRYTTPEQSLHQRRAGTGRASRHTSITPLAIPGKKRLNQDVQHVLKGNFVYELPIGPGKRFWNSGGISGKFFGGWQISGIAQFRTGRPISFISGRGTLNVRHVRATTRRTRL